MGYLVRKLIKRTKLDDIVTESNLENISADIPTTEFRTTDSNLSTWKIDKLEELDSAVLAIAVTSSELSRLDVIVIDEEILKEHELIYKQTYAGIDLIIPELQNIHYDIMNINYSKLKDCMDVYKKIFQKDVDGNMYIKRYSIGKIKEMLLDALKQDKIDETKANRKMIETLSKLKENL